MARLPRAVHIPRRAPGRFGMEPRRRSPRMHGKTVYQPLTTEHCALFFRKYQPGPSWFSGDRNLRDLPYIPILECEVEWDEEEISGEDIERDEDGIVGPSGPNVRWAVDTSRLNKNYFEADLHPHRFIPSGVLIYQATVSSPERRSEDFLSRSAEGPYKPTDIGADGESEKFYFLDGATDFEGTGDEYETDTGLQYKSRPMNLLANNAANSSEVWVPCKWVESL